MNTPEQSEISGDVPFELEKHIFYWLTQVLHRRNHALSRTFAPFKSSVAKWRVLGVLHDFPGSSMNVLAEHTAVDRTTLSRTIDQLESEGLVRRDALPTNKRILVLTLTAKGEETLKELLPLALEQSAIAMRGVTAKESEQLLHVLVKITRNLASASPIHKRDGTSLLKLSWSGNSKTRSRQNQSA